MTPTQIYQYLAFARVYIVAGFVYGAIFAVAYFAVKFGYERLSGKAFPRNVVTAVLDAFTEGVFNIPGIVNKVYAIAGLPPILFPSITAAQVKAAIAGGVHALPSTSAIPAPPAPPAAAPAVSAPIVVPATPTTPTLPADAAPAEDLHAEAAEAAQDADPTDSDTP